MALVAGQSSSPAAFSESRPPVVAAVSQAAAQTSVWPESSARDRRLEALVFDVEGSPAEFSADLLIRLARSGVVADPAWRRELLETAFRRAYGVYESHKRVAPNAPVDSRAGGFSRAYATGLDALTLQVRA